MRLPKKHIKRDAKPIFRSTAPQIGEWFIFNFYCLANDLLIIKLIYQVFKPERPENHYVQNKYFQNRKRYYVQNNQYHQYYKTNDQFRKKRDFTTS